MPAFLQSLENCIDGKKSTHQYKTGYTERKNPNKLKKN